MFNLNKKYKVIYADPPWSFKTYSEKGKGRSPDSYYDCMNLDDIKKLPVHEIADKDCVLFLWTVDPLLDKAFHVIESWGFEYKTVGFVWAKLNKKSDENYFSRNNFFCGLGYWTRSNTEICLLATKGKPKRKSKNVKKLIISKRREHSRKPDEIYENIENLLDGPYVELFSRNIRNGWDSWGKEVGLFQESLPKRKWKSKI